MEAWELEFIEDVHEYIDGEIIPDLHSAARYYDDCRTRPHIQRTAVVVKHLSYMRKSSDGTVEYVDNTLRDATIDIVFQYSADDSWESWTQLLTQFTATMVVPGVTVPTALKWESKGDSGRLKGDERYETDAGPYLATNITAKDAIRKAIHHHTRETVPQHAGLSDIRNVDANRIVALYEDEHEKVAALTVG